MTVNEGYSSHRLTGIRWGRVMILVANLLAWLLIVQAVRAAF